MDSKYISMYTHGFLYGHLKDINNEHLKNLAIQNYDNRVSSNHNETQSEDIVIPFDPFFTFPVTAVFSFEPGFNLL